MSQRIERVLDLLVEIGATYERGNPKSIRKVRAIATEVVAMQKGVAASSVGDIYRRQLAPEIQNAAEFDELLLEWLEGEGDGLQKALERKAHDDGDREAVRRFFDRRAA